MTNPQIGLNADVGQIYFTLEFRLTDAPPMAIPYGTVQFIPTAAEIDLKAQDVDEPAGINRVKLSGYRLKKDGTRGQQYVSGAGFWVGRDGSLEPYETPFLTELVQYAADYVTERWSS